MDQGFLHIETSDSHPGLIRLLATTGKPPSPSTAGSADPAIVYVARFNDVEAARLHAFTALRRYLLDVDAGLFRMDSKEAIATVESIGLAHRRWFIDPDLDEKACRTIADMTTRLVRRRERIENIWQAVGWLAAGWLVLLGLASF